ncbi:hypothetical protein [Burkholderia seminalis]|uniref:Uncharacterized protein n=2 Tax=Burkholderia cepacia complex TaxID=87882 RepID=A0A8A8D2V9_9BURK|nr:hypothetical protein [Burkholderia seminalis]QTO19078.1 hypothetical protein DT99_002180 [Burkholderia seminalis]
MESVYVVEPVDDAGTDAFGLKSLSADLWNGRSCAKWAIDFPFSVHARPQFSGLRSRSIAAFVTITRDVLAR